MSKKKVVLQAAFHHAGRNIFGGWAYDRADVLHRFCVELLVDGVPVSVTIADEFVQNLFEQGVGDGRFGFSFSLPEEVRQAAELVEARLANIGSAVGGPIEIARPENSSVEPAQIGELSWVGGLRFEGWLERSYAEVSVFVSEQLAATLVPTAWTHRSRGGAFQVVRRLDLHVPDHFADGRVRLLTATTAGGRSLTPMPVAFVAFDDGLERTLSQIGRWDSERLRGKLFDQLIPASIPFHRYAEWKQRFGPAAGDKAKGPAAVIVIGEKRIGETIESLESEQDIGWTAISLPTSGFCAIDGEAALDALAGEAECVDFLVFCPSGTVFAPGALSRFARAFEANPSCRCIYGDPDVPIVGGDVWPMALPAFDRERALEQGYAAMFFAMRRDDALNCLQNAASLYELFNLNFIDGEPEGILHLPGAIGSLPSIDIVLATQELQAATRIALEQDGVPASVEIRSGLAWPAVQIKRNYSRRERTTLIIPTRNRVELLSRCIETLQSAVRAENAEILVVDNGSTDRATLDFLDTLSEQDMRVILVEGPFNFARLNNLAVDQCQTENVCLVNNDIEAIDEGWLGEMLSRLVDPGVGAVGAKLLWPSQVIQHGGVVLGINFGAAHAFNDRMDGDPGYGGMLQVAHECSAVTAACLLMRRRDYLAVAGMDEALFPVNFNDVDLCLKLRERGYRIVFTPDAKLLHLESATRGRDQSPDRKARFERELNMLRAKWGDTLLDDPYYNPTLGLDSTPFSALAWPPRSFEARTNLARPARQFPAIS